MCDTDDSRLQAGLRRVHGAKPYASHKELLDKEGELAAVVVATPTHLHRDVALDCLAAGKHVFCEAPLAHTVEDCTAIAKAARAQGKVFAAGFQVSAAPTVAEARRRDIETVSGADLIKLVRAAPCSALDIEVMHAQRVPMSRLRDTVGQMIGSQVAHKS